MGKRNSEINILNLVSAIFIWIITSVWIYIIFMLSMENGYRSYARSYNIISLIQETVNIELTQTIIRKLAHIIEYGFLSVTIYLGLAYTNGISQRYSLSTVPRKTVKHTNELNIIYTFWLSTFISILDEYIQLFIEGREATLIDILIDSGSIVVMLLFVRIFFLIKLRLLRETEEEIG